MTYRKPAVLASYSESELVAEAAVCTGYGQVPERNKPAWWKKFFH